MEWATLQAGSSSRGGGWALSGGVSLCGNMLAAQCHQARSEERKS